MGIASNFDRGGAGLRSVGLRRVGRGWCRCLIAGCYRDARTSRSVRLSADPTKFSDASAARSNRQVRSEALFAGFTLACRAAGSACMTRPQERMTPASTTLPRNLLITPSRAHNSRLSTKEYIYEKTYDRILMFFRKHVKIFIRSNQAYFHNFCTVPLSPSLSTRGEGSIWCQIRITVTGMDTFGVNFIFFSGKWMDRSRYFIIMTDYALASTKPLQPRIS